MKLAVISDIHGNLEALEKVFLDISKKNVDQIICLGDVVGYGPKPNECIELILENKIKCVKGNHDETCTSLKNIESFNDSAADAANWTNKTLKENNKKYLEDLPNTISKDGMLFVHGSPFDPLYEYVDRNKVMSEEYSKEIEQNIKEKVIFVGHTHRPFNIKKNEYLSINPGSVGQPRDGDSRAAYCLFDTKTREEERGEIIRVEYDIAKTQDQMVKEKLPDFLINRLFHGE